MPNSLIDLRDWPSSEIKKLMDLSFSMEKETAKYSNTTKSVGLLFFESSTRTRVSFEMASAQEGYHSFLMTSHQGTSLDKGESIEDTLDNILAMKPKLLVVRSGDELDQKQYFQNKNISVISAGWGKLSHPTQALLDMRCLIKQGLSSEQIKMVIIGDIKHSRVAHSHFALAEKLGYQVAVLGPDSMMPTTSMKRFENLEEAFQWANVIMPLRYQKERHENSSVESDFKKYQVTKSNLIAWKYQGFLMHPGPVNYGCEITEDTRSYAKNLILSQVESGVWLRRAAIRHLLRDQT